MKDKKNIRDNDLDPEFNSGIAYLESIRKMLNKAHEAMVYSSFDVAYEYLKQVKIEVYPRKPKTYESTVSDYERKADYAYNVLNPKKEESIINFKKRLQDWNLHLSIYLHTCKLIMPDKADDVGAADV